MSKKKDRTSNIEMTSKEEKKNEIKKVETQVSFVGLFAYSDCFDKILLIIGFIMALASGGIFPVMYYMYGEIVGTVIAKQSVSSPGVPNPCFDPNVTYNITINSESQVYTYILYYVYFGLGSIGSNYLLFVCFERTADRQIKRIRNKLFKSLLSQEIAFYDINLPGQLNSRLTTNINTLRIGLGYKIGDFVSILSRALACFIYALISAWKFGLVMLSILPFMTISTILMVTFIKKYSINEYISYGSAGQIAQEVLASLRTVLSFGSMKKEINNYKTNLQTAETMCLKKGFFTGLFLGISLFFYNLVFAIGIFYGPYLVREECQSFRAEDILRSLFLMITATLSFGQGLPFLKDITEARAAAKDIYEIIRKKSSIDVFDQTGVKLNNIQNEIKFKKIGFSYPQRPDLKILQGLNLTIPCGKTIALCGSSGCGKTTILQLLQRFYDPDTGSVEIDNTNVKDLNLKWLREQIALVSQEPILFSTSIRENIRLGRLDATDREVEEAAKKSNAHDFIMKFSKKYDTRVGERGSQLSGGQKQRIAIARAILRNPKILLLDEATSALDYYSEKLVQNALDKAKIGRTTIIIAHRLNTIQNADLIVCLSNGKVKETGTHEELMTTKGVYYDLVMSQKKTEETTESDQVVIERDEIVETLDSTKHEIKHVETKKETIPGSSVILQLWKNHLPEKVYILIGVISQLLAGVVIPVASIIFTEIYTIFSLSKQEQEELSVKYLIIILGIAIGNILFYIISNYSFALLGARLTKRLRVKTFEAYLRQEVAFHDLDENKSSSLATHLAFNIPFCKGLTSDVLSLICQALSSVGFCVIYGLVIEWKLCLIIMSLIPINFLSGFINFQPASGKKKSYEELIGSLISETIENIRTVVSFTREEYFYDKFIKISSGSKKLLFLLVKGFFYALSNSVLFFMQAIAFGYSYKLLLNSELSLANFFKVYATITFSSIAMGQVFAQIPDLKQAKSAAQSTLQVLNRKSKIDSMSDKGVIPTKIIGDIEFKNVRFSYPNRREITVLNGLSINVRSGDNVALVGHSGCGKSTCIALLLRFYDVDEGEVLLDGVDIRKLNIGWLRSNIGIVSQEPVLFNLSIRDNICYGLDDQVSIDRVVDVAKMANINDLISSLPEKFDTMVGLKGSQLSGGEKQRIAIARTLIRQPKVLLLDEATSALDNQSEVIVQDALNRAQQGRTCLNISHRLNTIRNSDKICVLNEGLLIESGTHNDLVGQKGFYFELYNLLA
nr:ATP-binding cassette subfamily B1-like 10 [Brachionus rubens]